MLGLAVAGLATPAYAEPRAAPDVGADMAEASPKLTIAVAVSSSLTDEVIESFLRQAKVFHARVVFVGLPLTDAEAAEIRSRGHFAELPALQKRNKAILREGFRRLAHYAIDGLGVEIDPTLFERYGIEAVPTILFEIQGTSPDDTGESALVSGAPSILWSAQYAYDRIIPSRLKDALGEFLKANPEGGER